MINPVTVSIEVPAPIEQVYDFLDVVANHERFTNHYLADWRYAGPDRGVGACASFTVTLAGKVPVSLEVIETEPPRRIVEENVSAGGRRMGRGTYVLEAVRADRTRVSFEYRWLRAPIGDRLLSMVARAGVRRANQTAMQRLAANLSAQPALLNDPLSEGGLQ